MSLLMWILSLIGNLWEIKWWWIKSFYSQNQTRQWGWIRKWCMGYFIFQTKPALSVVIVKKKTPHGQRVSSNALWNRRCREDLPAWEWDRQTGHPPTHTRIHYYYYAASDLWQNFAVWKDKKKKKETPRKKEKKRGEARTAADDRVAKRKAVKRGGRKKERKKSMANESWATKIQGGCTQKRRGKASERDMRISSWPARGGEPAVVVVAGFHSRQDLTDQPQLHYSTHSFTAIELGGGRRGKRKGPSLPVCETQ